MPKGCAGPQQDICAFSMASDVLFRYGLLSPKLLYVNDSLLKPYIMEAHGIYNCLVFIVLSLLLLKADDTYLQLKKDLEYLDLKVSGIRVPA